MIIDVHVHPFCKEATWGDLDKIASAMWGLDPIKLKRMKVMLKGVASNISIDSYIELMNKFHIDKCVIVSFNVTTAYGVTLVTNEDVANFVSKYPKRFIGFGCVDVPAPDAMDQLEHAILSLDLKGIKIVPPVQKFDISDKKYDPLWKKMVDLNVPLWTHGGHQVSTAGSRADLGHPMLIDKMAMRNEDLTIIIGHMGTPWFWDTYSVVLRHPNVYVDISAHPDLYSYFPWDAYSKYNIEHKILFGSDHPLVHWNNIVPAAQNLPISDSFKKKIMGENAVKLFSFK
ncbi:MAG: amidohydrolase family protein [Promethearchaeota archaeon]